MKAITTGQKDQCATVVKDAARKAAEEAISELEENGALDGDSIQRVQGNPKLSAKIKAYVKGLIVELAENIRGCLKLISGAETLTLDSTDGTEVIAEAGSLFNGYLDSDFRNWKTNVKGNPTEAQNVQVHEMTKDGTFEQIYGGLGDNLDVMCLSQAQIIQFVKKHRKWLREDGYGTFFLFKVGDEFFVASVGVDSDGSLYASVNRVSRDGVWFAGYRRRFVVPQLALASA